MTRPHSRRTDTRWRGRSVRPVGHRTPTRAVAVVGALVALGALVAACGGGEPDPAATPGVTDGPTTTVTVTSPTFDIDPSVPDDPAELPPCAGLDTPGDRQLPTRWLPTSLPDGTDLAVAGTTLRPADPPTESGLQVLLATDGPTGDGAVTDGGEVTAEVVVEFSPTDGFSPTDDATPDDEPTTTLRGVPAQVETSDGSTGPAGVVTARWSESGRSWAVQAAGIDEAALVELVERVELTERGAVDPTGDVVEVAAAPGRYAEIRTEVGLAAAGASPREYGVVVEEHDGGTGLPIITGLVPRTGLELGELAGRPALRGTLGGSRVLMTTTSDGAAVYAYGTFDADELDELVDSLERVDPDDERLVGLPMDWVAGGDRFCRDD